MFYLLLGVIFLAVVIYETGQQLREQQEERLVADDGPDVARAGASLYRYYRAHDFPTNWQVGEIVHSEGVGFDVPVHFSPSVNSPSYGQAAPAGEISADTACPIDEDAVWSDAAGHAIRILVNDKSGVIDRIDCAPPSTR